MVILGLWLWEDHLKKVFININSGCPGHIVPMEFQIKEFFLIFQILLKETKNDQLVILL